MMGLKLINLHLTISVFMLYCICKVCIDKTIDTETIKNELSFDEIIKIYL
jgi:hypothetical protein